MRELLLTLLGMKHLDREMPFQAFHESTTPCLGDPIHYLVVCNGTLLLGVKECRNGIDLRAAEVSESFPVPFSLELSAALLPGFTPQLCLQPHALSLFFTSERREVSKAK